MRLGMVVFGAAALVGAGYVIGKKLIEKKRGDDFYEFDDMDDIDGIIDEDCTDCNRDEDDCDCSSKDGYKSKIRRAGLFMAGAIKTSADKLGETIEDIKNKDMIKKGEQAVGAVKETGGNIKNDIKLV